MTLEFSIVHIIDVLLALFIYDILSFAVSFVIPRGRS